jgi:multidrug efflux pump subunit AcrA (membrane-fusion protein)
MSTYKIGIVCMVAGMAASCGPKYDRISPKVAPATEAVFASGSIDPKDAYMVTSLSDGFIVKSFVEENDLVRDKQVLFRLDNRQQHTQVNIANTNLAYAKINAAANSPTLLQIKSQMDAAMAKVVTDSTTLARYEHLYVTHTVSKQDLDNARLSYQTSLANYNADLENYRATADKVAQDLETSREQLQNAQEGDQYYNLTAIGAAKVYQIFKKQGDLVRRGDQVAQLGNPDSIVINLDVDESMIAKVRLGQRVLVELNTEKNKPYEATVSKIYPHFNETSQSYKVEARFTSSNPGLIAGTQLQANIITNVKENALLVPHTYVSADNKVVLQKGDKMDTVKIKPGIVSDEWVEILDGISANDVLMKLKQ